jgi:hypothetical protein
MLPMLARSCVVAKLGIVEAQAPGRDIGAADFEVEADA